MARPKHRPEPLPEQPLTPEDASAPASPPESDERQMTVEQIAERNAAMQRERTEAEQYTSDLAISVDRDRSEDEPVVYHDETKSAAPTDEQQPTQAQADTTAPVKSMWELMTGAALKQAWQDAQDAISTGERLKAQIEPAIAARWGKGPVTMLDGTKFTVRPAKDGKPAELMKARERKERDPDAEG